MSVAFDIFDDQYRRGYLDTADKAGGSGVGDEFDVGGNAVFAVAPEESALAGDLSVCAGLFGDTMVFLVDAGDASLCQ